MKREAPHLSLKIAGNEDGTEENAVINWIVANSKWIISGLLAAAAIVFIAYRFSAGNHVQTANDYIKADNAWQMYLRSLAAGAQPKEVQEGKAALEELTDIVKKRPELSSKYDGQLAQAYIVERNGKEAKVFGNEALRRTEKDKLPAYHNYAIATLAISAEELQMAYEDALALNETLMAKEDENSRLLYLYNLFKIASLEQALKLNQQEAKTLEKISFLLSNPEASKFHRLDKERFLQLFSYGSLTYEDYIRHRLSLLQN